MRPCAAACLRGHTTWLGGVAAWFDGGFPWVQSRRALARLSRRRREIRRSGALDGLVAQGSAPCAHALRASACATAEGAGGASARSQRAHIAHLWEVDGEEAAGSHAWAATRSACSRRARSGAACWQRGGNERAHTARAIASRGRIGGGARCTPRGRGRRPRGRGRVTGARGSHNDAALATAPPPALPSSRSLGGTKKKLRAFMHGARRRPRGPAFGFLIRSCPYELP